MAGRHPRNVSGMLEAARCGAKTRNGTPCAAPAVKGRKRCRMHGGAKGSGAPKGNRNALKTGLHTAEERDLRQLLRELTRETKQIIEKM
jgi:hypothetical protein